MYKRKIYKGTVVDTNEVFVCDTRSDIASLPTDVAYGSSAFVIEDSTTWMINSSGSWVETDLSGGGGGGGGDVDGDNLVETTWAELKTLRDDGGLIPGTQYRITDYTCTVANDENAVAESHPYDIIVTADSESVLNENARAALKDGDTYYYVDGKTDANLKAWELKYCLDNDTLRFDWADEENGKGVVYFLRDDRQNECWYDFKQIKFARYKITAYNKNPSLIGEYTAMLPMNDITIDTANPEWLFTFCGIDDENNVCDASIDASYRNDVCENKIGFTQSYGEYMLANNIIFNGGFNIIGQNCQYITLNDGCANNVIGNSCTENTFGNNCKRNIIGIECVSNIFGNDCTDNTLGSVMNDVYGNECSANHIGSGASHILGDKCTGIKVLDASYITLPGGDNERGGVFNYTILGGYYGDNHEQRVLDGVTYGNSFETFIGIDSNGNLKYWNPMDSAT